jgi:hypothetical protein
MAEVRFQIDDAWLKNLKDKIGAATSTDIARDAYALLNWAADQKAAGRDIASTEGDKLHSKLAMPSLDKIPSS